MEDSIDDITEWRTFCKLKLNKDNAELLSILPACQTHKYLVDIITIMIGGCEIKSSDCVRNQGVVFDSSM